MKGRLLPGAKWAKHVQLVKSETVRQHLPQTEIYRPELLESYLNRYHTVFVKPSVGTGGRRIFRVRRTASRYEVRLEHRQRTFDTLAGVTRWIDRERRGDRFLIQQGVNLVQWKQRPVDLRTIVQRNEQAEWEVTGMFSKSAGKQLAVTNVSIGGSAHTIETYLKGIGYDAAEIRQTKSRLRELTLAVARRLNGYRNAVYGLDIGLDANGKLWIIEVNTMPHLSIFKRLGLSRMYRRSTALWNRHRGAIRSAQSAIGRKRR